MEHVRPRRDRREGGRRVALDPCDRVPRALARRRLGHVRRADLPEGCRDPAHARAVPGGRRLPRGHPAVSCPSRLREHRDARPVARDRGGERRTGPSHHGSVDLAGRLPARDRLAERRRGATRSATVPGRRRHRSPCGMCRCACGRSTGRVVGAGAGRRHPRGRGRRRRRGRERGASSFIRVRYEGGLAGTPGRPAPEISPSNVTAWSTITGPRCRRGPRRRRSSWSRHRGTATRTTSPSGRCCRAWGGATASSRGNPRERFRAFVRRLVAPAMDRLGGKPMPTSPTACGRCEGPCCKASACSAQTRTRRRPLGSSRRRRALGSRSTRRSRRPP